MSQEFCASTVFNPGLPAPEQSPPAVDLVVRAMRDLRMVMADLDQVSPSEVLDSLKAISRRLYPDEVKEALVEEQEPLVEEQCTRLWNHRVIPYPILVERLVRLGNQADAAAWAIFQADQALSLEVFPFRVTCRPRDEPPVTSVSKASGRIGAAGSEAHSVATHGSSGDQDKITARVQMEFALRPYIRLREDGRARLEQHLRYASSRDDGPDNRHARDSTASHSDSVPAHQGNQQHPDLESHAMAVLFSEPTLPLHEIAKRVGVARTTLYRWKRFKSAAELAGKLKPRGKKQPINRRGHKGPSGTLEAWNEARDD